MARPAKSAVLLEDDQLAQKRARRRRLIEASRWRSDDIEGIRDYVRLVERAIARCAATFRMRGSR